MTTQRLALADVLGVLSPLRLTADFLAGHRVFCEAARVDVGMHLLAPRDAESVLWHRWLHPSPADALGALVEAELLPEHWARAMTAPGWWSQMQCGLCRGDGGDCYGCGGDGWKMGATPTPPSHAALVAVASLGVDALARAEAIG